MVATRVDEIHKEFSELLEFLSEKGEITLQNSVEEHFRKLLLVAAASYFEKCLTESIIDFAKERIEESALVSLIENEVVSRRYHSWFDWDARNINRFFKLFGKQFREYAKARAEEDDEIGRSITSFIEIGHERNLVMHNDFGSFPLNKTSKEIYDLYLSARKFVEWFPDIMRSFSSDRTDT